MCVLIARVGERPFLAANRDEAYARPFSSPRRWVADVPFWAPRDEEEGGTWIGVNRHGLTAAITNRSRIPDEPDRESRGKLVTGALARPDLAAARAWLLAELARAPRNPCQILLARRGEALVCEVGPDGVAWETLSPGIHVLSNLHDRGEIDFRLDAAADFSAVRPILADPSPRLPRGFAVCKRAGWRGTVASAYIEPGVAFLFAPGPPDATDYTPVGGYPA